MKLQAIILVSLCIVLGAVMPCAHASITVPGADGSDGTFAPTANVVVDLSQAVTGHWDDNNAANAGKGVYDPDKWAVVFKYSSVNIPAGATVTFVNHPSGAPVVWLVSGNVSIAGNLSVKGADTTNTGEWADRAPGGFRGGPCRTGAQSSVSGLGPGGGHTQEGQGSWPGIYTYGSPDIRQLVGGSGGAGSGFGGGAAGGGALLIACANTIAVSGAIDARGGDGYNWYGSNSSGSGGGSGGAVRLVSDWLTGGGLISCNGYNGGGQGRIRIETNHSDWIGTPNPAPSTVPVGTAAAIWQPDGSPTLKITQIGSAAVPSDTHAGMPPFQDVQISTTAPIAVTIQATNVPSTWNVVLRAVSRTGADVSANATKVSGDDTSSVWTAELALPQGFTSMIARASKP